MREKWMMTNRSPLANPNRSPSPDWAWPVQGSKEVASAQTAGPVIPAAFVDTELPAGEWVPIPIQAPLSVPTTQAMPYARLI